MTHRVLDRRSFLASSAALTSALFLQRRTFGQDIPDAGISKLKDLFVHAQHPLNAEPELAELVAKHITPLESFYIRSHGPVPQLEAQQVKLRVEGMVRKPREFSIDEVQGQFRRHAVEATLTCAGNRREEHSAVREVSGVQWREGAIGNARWSGASLAEVLRSAELQPGAKHVWFEGLDPIKEKDGSSAPFGGSIPLDKALANAEGELSLLADTMNDKKLLPEHGFPLRTLVPGYIGARSVKWLTKITVSDRPSPNHFVADAYKLIQEPEQTKDREPIYPYVINSAICLPADGAQLKSGKTRIAGYALPTGEAGSAIEKVEVSVDGGKTWREAALDGKAKPFVWRLWHADVELPAGSHELVVRATDSKGNEQPKAPEWNLKGYLFNGWHRVKVEVA